MAGDLAGAFGSYHCDDDIVLHDAAAFDKVEWFADTFGPLESAATFGIMRCTNPMGMRRCSRSNTMTAHDEVPAGTVTLNPALPPGLHRLEVHGIPFPGGELSVMYDCDATLVTETPHGLRVSATG